MREHFTDIFDKKQSLNLVSEDWKQLLDHSYHVKLFSTDPYRVFGPWFNPNVNGYSCQKIQSQISEYKILVAGIWRLGIHKNQPVMYTYNNEVLNEICASMFSDMEGSVQFESFHRFFTSTCTAFTCIECDLARHFYIHKGYEISHKNSLCVSNTFVYDGKEIKNCFPSMIDKHTELFGVVHLTVDSRLTYKSINNNKFQEICRIGGKIDSCFLTLASNLNFCSRRRKELYFGSNSLENGQIEPKIQNCVELISNQEASMDQPFVADDEKGIEKDDSENFEVAIPSGLKGLSELSQYDVFVERLDF